MYGNLARAKAVECDYSCEQLDTTQRFPLECGEISISVSTGAALPSQRQIKVKICGITTVEDARLVAEAGVDYIGVLINVEFSPRCLTIEQARPICEQSALPVVALLFNSEAEQIQEAFAALGFHAVQLLGQEPASLVKELKGTTDYEVWKSIHLPPQGKEEVNISTYKDNLDALSDAGVDAILIDTVVNDPKVKLRYGGTGQVNNWTTARKLVETIPVHTFLAGGIKPENVQQAIDLVQPYGIDLCSGVESSPGRKDPEKLHRLMNVVKGSTQGVISI